MDIGKLCEKLFVITKYCPKKKKKMWAWWNS